MGVEMISDCEAHQNDRERTVCGCRDFETLRWLVKVENSLRCQVM